MVSLNLDLFRMNMDQGYFKLKMERALNEQGTWPNMSTTVVTAVSSSITYAVGDSTTSLMASSNVVYT